MAKIAAGIITFNPDIERLTENVLAIIKQVDEVFIFDNASSNYAEIEAKFRNQCTLIPNGSGKNIGIASALNRLFDYCEKEKYEWVLTLDQDSVCPSNIISEYNKYLDDGNPGILSARINDRNVGEIESLNESVCEDIDACITSASLLKVKAWRDVGGFWDELFIDMVDFDICWNLRTHGYRILRVNSVVLLHEIGHSEKKVFRNKEIAVFNHSPLRYYYIIRNTIAVGRKYRRKYQCLRWNLKRIYLVLKYEDNKRNKLYSMFFGLIDGLLNNLGPNRHNF